MALGDAKHPLTSMEGSGFYNRHSGMQAAGITLLLSLWEKAARSVKLDADNDAPLVIADYGSSQGRNSMRPMQVAIREFRARVGPNRPIEVIHTDLPSNDFAALFTALGEEPDSYMAGASGIFPSAIGRSYFEPIIPPNRVHLGWNTWTMQWMSRIPISAPDHVLATLSASADVRKAVMDQQAVDWMSFLKMRSSELRRGAKLLTAFPGKTADETGWEWLGGELWKAIVDLRDAGLISEEEQMRITLPTAPRSLEAIKAPFGQSGLFEGLELEHAEIFKVPDSSWTDFQRTGDKKSFGQLHANTTRAWSGPTIMALLAPNRDRVAVMNALYTRLAERLAMAPRPHEPYLSVAILGKR
jgi:hypothetical protein